MGDEDFEALAAGRNAGGNSVIEEKRGGQGRKVGAAKEDGRKRNGFKSRAGRRSSCFLYYSRNRLLPSCPQRARLRAGAAPSLFPSQMAYPPALFHSVFLENLWSCRRSRWGRRLRGRFRVRALLPFRRNTSLVWLWAAWKVRRRGFRGHREFDMFRVTPPPQRPPQGVRGYHSAALVLLAQDSKFGNGRMEDDRFQAALAGAGISALFRGGLWSRCR